MAPNIVVSRPTFPIYLLPSISFPFRRRRPSSSSTTTSEPSSTPDASQVPSLSSSPTQSTTDETITPPNSPPPPPPSYQDAIVSSGPVVADHLPPGKRQTRRPKRLTRTQPDTLRCSTCSSDIAFSSQIVSKGFTGRYGRAYLVAPTVPAPPRSPGTIANSAAGPEMLANVRIGKCENRQLVTGWHVVADITCLLCSAKLGWKYVDAKELSQKYKVGKFILEVERVVPFRSWEDVSEEDDDDDNDGESQGSVGEDEDDEMEGNRLDNDVSERNGDEGAGESSEGDDEVEIVFDSEDEDDLEDMFSGTWDPEVVAKRRGRRVTAARKK
ncbi:Yippee family protein [Colletotrichum truncatum]|uniref:Yippee family protein n=1 Tax=Colletotrichum truncatum TaxID=5467 RepID=A0ACC3ZE33_COLTU|nr:Yippee family protein [Colletotrichum truncatum]KAF6794888.1 Yippee family protein [Colletotrichum truncatum]